jgi:hypothetical protein
MITTLKFVISPFLNVFLANFTVKSSNLPLLVVKLAGGSGGGMSLGGEESQLQVEEYTKYSRRCI